MKGKKLLFRFGQTILILGLAMSILTACGSKQSSPPANQKQEVGSKEKPATGIAALAEAAKKEGKVVYYESSTPEAIAKIGAAFNKNYPGIKLEQGARLNAANIGSRIITESQGGTETADVATTGGDTGVELAERGLLNKIKPGELGFDPKLAEDNWNVATAYTIYVIIYNKDSVSKENIPKKWEDILDPKWRGKIGAWDRPNYLGQLTPAWGKDKARDFAKKLSAQNLVLYNSTYPLAEAVGAGELALGIGIYHSVQPSIQKGAPIGVVFLDPTPVTPLYSMIPTKASHPNAAKLFLSWLVSPEGNKVYEEATGRGNPAIPGSKSSEILSKVKISYTPLKDQKEVPAWLKELASAIGGTEKKK